MYHLEQVMVRLSNFYEVRWWGFYFAWGQMKRFFEECENIFQKK